MNTLHKTLTPERWRGFDFPTQILMVANEVNRASNALGNDDAEGAKMAWARALELLDLTVEVHRRGNLVRELLRWRTLAADQYRRDDRNPESARALLKTLLLFSGPSARQIPYLC